LEIHKLVLLYKQLHLGMTGSSSLGFLSLELGFNKPHLQTREHQLGAAYRTIPQTKLTWRFTMYCLDWENVDSWVADPTITLATAPDEPKQTYMENMKQVFKRQ